MSRIMRKKDSYTIITPIPSFIPRQLALDILHAHSEIITLNPLVLSHAPIPAPRNAAADEFYSTWYEITERIQYVPGLGSLGAGKISFKGCFHDTPWGLQTHIYAPMGVDLRTTYRIAGNEPGEPPAPTELGLLQLGAPSDGLYLREDNQIRCNIALLGFVRSQLKAASHEMMQRLVKKAELLDAGILRAMFCNGRLRTVNPHDLSNAAGQADLARSMSLSPRPHSLSPRLAPTPTPGPASRPGYQPLAPPQPAPPLVELPGDFVQPRDPTQLQVCGGVASAQSSPSFSSGTLCEYGFSPPQSPGLPPSLQPGAGAFREFKHVQQHHQLPTVKIKRDPHAGEVPPCLGSTKQMS
ncbi:hypothetical protein BROUX41_002943 [Berkeleyomyces rouxiae]